MDWNRARGLPDAMGWMISGSENPFNDNDFDETKEKVLEWIGRHFVDDELEKVLKKSELAWWTTN